MSQFINDTIANLPMLRATGRLDAVNSIDFELAVDPLLKETKFLIIDLAQCSYLSSAGIRILLKTHKQLLAKQGKLHISGMLPEVYQVIEMAGLHRIFHLTDTPETAAELIGQVTSEIIAPHFFEVNNKRFEYRATNTKKHPLLYWRSNDIAGYNELGFAVGYGSPAESDDQELLNIGLFVTAGTCAGFIPDNVEIPADFRVASDPSQIAVFSHGAVSFEQQPSGVLQSKETSISLQEMVVASQSLQTDGSSLSVIINNHPSLPSLSFILNIDDENNGLDLWKHIPEFHRRFIHQKKSTTDTGLTFTLANLYQSDSSLSLRKLITDNLSIENILDVQTVNPDEQLQQPLCWLFVPEGIADAEAHRLHIETSQELELEPYKLFLIRRLYTDATRVIVQPLHGGYSAQTYQVTSFDSQGRKMRPTVLKMANRAIISRESERCQQYALPYIFNNSAAVLGAGFHGDKGALRYNFVGIGGEASSLKWLTHYYHQEDMEMLSPLFDKIFLEILKPWYGQPVAKNIYPYKDHDPTFTFFPHIYQTVSDLFRIDADKQYIAFKEAGRQLLNPYWFLKHEFPKRRQIGLSYFESICHGDLNMQNILLDERMNVYLIDFSETKPRSAISDFARLEAIFLVDNAPVENDEDMDAYLRYITTLYTVDRLNEIPAQSYTGRHQEKVQKSAALSFKMRKYAFDCVQGNPDVTPYYLALLEWVLPVVCYNSVSNYQKRLSTYICGLLCEKII